MAALGQATPYSSEAPETTWVVVIAVSTLAEAGITLPTKATGTASTTTAAMRDRNEPLGAAHRIAGHRP